MSHYQRNSSPSPPKEDYSLKSDDIPGAQVKVIHTKRVDHYANKMPTDNSKYQDMLQNGQWFQLRDVMFGSGDLYRASPSVMRRQGKRLYQQHYNSQIGENQSLKLGHQTDTKLQQFDYPRNLSISDIPGAVAGSKKSKAVLNHNLSEKIRSQNPLIKRSESIGNINRGVNDSLDQFYKEKSFAVKATERFEPRHAGIPTQYDNDAYGGVNLIDNKFDMRENVQSPEKKMRHSTQPQVERSSVKWDDQSSRQENNEDNIYEEKAAYSRHFGGRAEEPAQLEYKNDLDAYLVKPQKKVTGRSASIPNMRPNEQQQQQQQQAQAQGSMNYHFTTEGVNNSYRETEPQDESRLRLGSKPEKNLKRVLAYNILSNQADVRSLPSNTRLPYRYAIPVNVDQVCNYKGGEEYRQTRIPSREGGNSRGTIRLMNRKNHEYKDDYLDMIRKGHLPAINNNSTSFRQIHY